MNNKKMRLSMEIPQDMHRGLKYKALELNCTVTDYVIRAIVERLTREETYFNKQGENDDKNSSNHDSNFD